VTNTILRFFHIFTFFQEDLKSKTNSKIKLLKVFFLYFEWFIAEIGLYVSKMYKMSLYKVRNFFALNMSIYTSKKS
jgi:hypothetical protein